MRKIRFIELTAEDTGRTISVLAKSIVAVIDRINDDKPTRHTSEILLTSGACLHVRESKPSIVQGLLGDPFRSVRPGEV